MDQHLLPVPAIEHANRFHERQALTLPVARVAIIDVPGVETERAVVAVASAPEWSPNHRLALLASERPVACLHTRTLSVLAASLTPIPSSLFTRLSMLSVRFTPVEFAIPFNIVVVTGRELLSTVLMTRHVLTLSDNLERSGFERDC